MKQSARYAWQAKDLLDNIARQGRDRTPDEDRRIESLLAKSRQAMEAEDDDGVQERIKGLALGGDLGREIGGGDLSGGGQRPGDVFVASEAYRRIADPAARGTRWSSGTVEIKGYGARTKASLLEGDVDTAGSGGAAVPYDPGLASSRCCSSSPPLRPCWQPRPPTRTRFG